MISLPKTNPRKLQKAPPTDRSERYLQIISTAQAPKPPRRNPSILTKAPPAGLSWRTTGDSIPIAPLNKPSLSDETANPDTALNEVPEPSSSSHSLRGPRSVRSRLWRACRKLKIVAGGQKHREHFKQMHPSVLLKSPILTIMDIESLSAGQKITRASQVAMFKELLSEFKHHTSMLDYKINAPSHNDNQALMAMAMKDKIAPAGVKLKLFLTLIRLEDELDKSTLKLQQLCKHLIEERKRLKNEMTETEDDFRLAYEELASRDRGELKDEYWTIFDTYQRIIWEDWPLPA